MAMTLPRTARVTLLAGLLPGVARSQTPLGPEFQVNTFTTGEQRHTAVTADAVGNFVVVWSSDGQDGSAGGIMGRRFDALGNPRGGEFQVNTTTTGNQSFPAVASDRAGNFVVVWESARDAAGNFVVVWQSFGQEGPGGDYGVYAQRFDAVGQRQGGEFRVNAATPGNQRSSAVAADRGGAFTVVWSGPDAGGDRVWARRYDAAGAPLGLEFPVDTFTTAGQSAPPVVAVAADANANVVMAWASSGQDGGGLGIAANRFGCDGQGLGVGFLANTITANDQTDPSIAASSGDFVVIWTSDGQDGSGQGVFGRRFRGLPACGRFYTVTPCRLADTRQATGPTGGPSLAANEARGFPVGGACGIPADAKAVAFNITTTNQTEVGNLRLYPAGEPLPLSSSSNFGANHPRPTTPSWGWAPTGSSPCVATWRPAPPAGPTSSSTPTATSDRAEPLLNR